MLIMISHKARKNRTCDAHGSSFIHVSQLKITMIDETKKKSTQLTGEKKIIST